jgi:DNA helicase IV
MAHPELATEQAHVDHAYEQLEAMRANALAMLRAAFGERGGTFQAITERDIRVRTSLNRLEQLQLGRESLVFGRIDRADPTEPGGPGEPGEPGTEAFHIGRLAVADDHQEPLVVDWRAPVAEPFYRATGAQPMGLTRRRHFLTDGRRVLDLEDELFGDGALGGDGRAGDEAFGGRGLGAGLSGSGALLSALERSRTGRMRDIVATVQREQDEIIRSPLSGVLVVQGGPGTGKTAVALHRAAYLLYTYRFPLETQGVLVVGPNPLFLRYIEHVLPSLGETGVEMSTVGRLYGPSVATGVDDRPTAALKGDPRMSRFLARAVASRERPLRRPVEVPYGAVVLIITPAASSEIVHAARRRAGTHNSRRRVAEQLLWRYLHARLLEARARPVPERWSTATAAQVDEADDEGDEDEGDLDVGEPNDITPAELGSDLRRLPVVAEALDRMWPVLTPQELLRDLYGAAPLIELAGRGLLSEKEQALLLRPRSDSIDTVAWTDSDLALLDESRALLGSPKRQPSEDETPRAYGHIVVDEAQDLTPMQWRMLGRRSLSSSMSIVGDIAQATGPWAPGSWAAALEHLPTRRDSRVVELTVNYRTPSEIMDLAGRVLAAAAPGMTAPQSVRSTGAHPMIAAAAALELPSEVARAVVAEAAELARESASGGTIGVICAPSMAASLGLALGEAKVGYGSLEAGALDDIVTLVTVGAVKGLEFDSVIVVEPARIVAESAQGLRALYVALTRATRRLMILHAEPLPPPLLS